MTGAQGRGRRASNHGARRADSYVRIFASVHSHPSVLTLPHPAFRLWFELRAQWIGSNNGQLKIVYSMMARRGWKSHSTLERARDELLQRGLIKRTKYCGPNAFHRASLYALTDLDVVDSELDGIVGSAASHDYRHWVNPEKGRVCRSPRGGTEPPRMEGSFRPARRGTGDENRPAKEGTANRIQRIDAKYLSRISSRLSHVPLPTGIRNIVTKQEVDVAVEPAVELAFRPVVFPPSIFRVPATKRHQTERGKER